MADWKREATRREVALWNKFRRNVQISVNLQALNQLFIKRLNIAYSFAQIWGVSIPQSYVDEYQAFKKAANENRINSQFLAKLSAWVETGELGLKFFGNDFDIVAPPGLNEDELTYYRTGGFGAFPWIAIAIAALIFGSAVGASVHLWKENRKLTKRLKIVLDHADKELCKDKNSNQCKAWEDRKKEADWVENESLSDSIKKNLAKLGEKIGTGLQYGAMIALPLIVLYLIAKRERK